MPYCPKGHTVERVAYELRAKFRKKYPRRNAEAYRYCKKCKKYYYVGDLVIKVRGR